MGLGDAIHKALDAVGVTEQVVHRWLGPECGCRERQEKLNQIGRWASRVLSGRMERAKEYLERTMR